MMWQSSIIISLLVLSHEQIYIPITGKHGYFYHRPITLLEPLVVLIGRHKDMLVKISKGGEEEEERWNCKLVVQAN